MKKIMGVLIGVFSLLFLSGTVLGEVDYSPGKFDEDGTIGKKRRIRQIYTRDINISGMVQPGVVIVNKWTDFEMATESASGASVYRIDLSLGNEFWIDVDAIRADVATDIALSHASATTGGPTGGSVTGATAFDLAMLQVTTGVTILAPKVDATNDKAIFKLKKIGTSGVTPIRLWAAYDEWVAGTTLFQTIEAVYPINTPSGMTNYSTASSVSDYPIYEPSDSKTYMLCNADINSGDSIFVVDMTHRAPYLH